MRIPKISNYSSIPDKVVLDLPETEYNKPSYIMYDNKIRSKFIKKVESIVRTSYEYKRFIEFCHLSLGMTYDMFYNNVSKDKAKRVSIEIHHIPFTMYDIVATVLRKYEEEEIPIDPYAIAEEVVTLHYKGMVSLVPLSTTVHELYHRGDVFIPLQYVDKGFVLFYQAYKPYLVDYEPMLIKLVALSKAFDIKTANPILKRQLVYLNNEGYSSTPERL